jgi:hypothetical protein
MDKVKVFLQSLLSRKFLISLAGAYLAWDAGWSDGVMTQQELMIVLSPIFGYLGVEGYADAKEREAQQPKVTFNVEEKK